MMLFFLFFFFKQKTAYEMRISDWSSDVCSSDLGTKFLLLSAFLRGATNPPPEDWIRTVETWKRKDKDKTLWLQVPEGAKQLVLFFVPETGGASDAISDTVRGRPGEFVRAIQALNQASLDRSRLAAFMGAIQAQANTHPEYLRTLAHTLARRSEEHTTDLQ